MYQIIGLIVVIAYGIWDTNEVIKDRNKGILGTRFHIPPFIKNWIAKLKQPPR